jgi:hypothetical protein
MWLPTRRFSTAFYLFMIIIVFVVALLKQSVFLVLFLLVVEIIAGTWYSISYIPFGRKIVCSFFRSLGVCYPCFYVHDSVRDACAKQNNSGGVFGGSSTSNNDSSSMTNVFGGTPEKQNSSSFFGGSK